MSEEVITVIELCPHMGVVITSRSAGIYEFNCFRKSINPCCLCSLDFYDQSGTMFTTFEEMPKKIQETCFMHYTVEDIVSKQKAFEKHIANITNSE